MCGEPQLTIIIKSLRSFPFNVLSVAQRLTTFKGQRHIVTSRELPFEILPDDKVERLLVNQQFQWNKFCFL